MSVATYTFLPWLRRGIGNRIQAAAGAGARRAPDARAQPAKKHPGQLAVPPVTVQ
jgi:hypothetical protein